MMQILIFVTHARAELTNDYQKPYAGFNVQEQEVDKPIKITIDNEKQLLFAYVKEFGEGGNLTDAINKLIGIWNEVGNGDKIRIFIHHRSINDNVLNSIKDALIKSSIAFYSHIDNTVWPILTEIKRICQGGTLDNNNERFKKLFDELWNLHSAGERKRKLSIIKHRIMHWFLPMDIDFQGISELLNQEKEDEARQYLKDILNPNINRNYQEQLAALWYALAKYQLGKGKKGKNQKEAKSDDQNKTHNIDILLNKEKAISELICGKTEEKVINAWKSLLNVSGLSYSDTDPFKDIKHNPEAPICKFMGRLDSLKKNWEPNKSGPLDIRGIIKISDASETLKNLMPNGANIIDDMLFPDWFCLLMKCLTELEEALGGVS